MRETLIRTVTDPDFGQLNLVETQADANPDGSPPATYRTWLGETAAPHGCILIIGSEDELALIAPPMRESYRRALAGIDGLKSRIAEAKLDLAREWAESGDLQLDLDAPKFAQLLRLDGVDVAPHQLTLYFLEDAEIFAGHVLEMRLNETGEITEIKLAG